MCYKEGIFHSALAYLTLPSSEPSSPPPGPHVVSTGTVGDKRKNMSDQRQTDGAAAKDGKERGGGESHRWRGSGEQDVEPEERTVALTLETQLDSCRLTEGHQTLGISILWTSTQRWLSDLINFSLISKRQPGRRSAHSAV